jgi:tetratricopeptide (TPR) repeat protein
LQAVHIEQTESQKIHDFYDWELRPETDSTLNIKVKVTLGSARPWFGISAPIFAPIFDMKAWEADSGEKIKVSEKKEGDRMIYTVEIPGWQGKGYEFYWEFNLLFSVWENPDDVYSFEWSWRSEESETTHTATVILPKKHEFLFSDYIEPTEVSSSMGKVSVAFSEEREPDEPFEIGVTFSKKGVQLLEKAESNFRLGRYSEAKEFYQDAIDFYSQFDELYDKDPRSFLADLRSKVSECDVKAEEEADLQSQQEAEEKLNEARALFDAGDYAKAQPIFQQAQNMYLSAGNSEKADECQSYIDQCKQFAAKTEAGIEADSLFDEGVSLFEQQQYPEAKTKFEEALAKYKELQDEDKIKECEEWIASCEEQAQPEEGKEGEDGGGPCIGSSLIVITLLGAALTRAFRYRS